jgi:hypothetical protein
MQDLSLLREILYRTVLYKTAVTTIISSVIYFLTCDRFRLTTMDRGRARSNETFIFTNIVLEFNCFLLLLNQSVFQNFCEL